MEDHWFIFSLESFRLFTWVLSEKKKPHISKLWWLFNESCFSCVDTYVNSIVISIQFAIFFFFRSLWVHCRTCHSKRSVKPWQKSLALILYLPTWIKWEAIIFVAWIMLCLFMFRESEPKCSMLFIVIAASWWVWGFLKQYVVPWWAREWYEEVWSTELGCYLMGPNVSFFLFLKVVVVIGHKELLIWLSCLHSRVRY